MTNTDGLRLVNEIESNLRLFAYMSEHDYVLGSLWIAQSHLRDIDGDFLPYYSGRWYIGSNKPGCGKSLVSTVAIEMCYNGKMVLNPTPPAMVANYHELKRTVAFDEFDQYMGRGSKPTITTIINGGWQRGATTENVRRDVIVEYDITGPMMLVGKNLQLMYTSEHFATIKTRSFITALERKPKDAEVMKFNPEIHTRRLNNIRDLLTRWGMTHAQSILRTKVKLPDGIINRDEDIWTPLFRIAEFIGGEWPKRIERAAKAMVLNIHDTDSMPIVTPYDELLAAVRSTFDIHYEYDFITTAFIVDELLDMNDTWWTYEWDNERSAAMGLSSALKSFGIESSQKRFGDQVLRGYTRSSVMTDGERSNLGEVKQPSGSEATSEHRSNRSEAVPHDGWDEGPTVDLDSMTP